MSKAKQADGETWADVAAANAYKKPCGTCGDDRVRPFVVDACRARLKHQAEGRKTWTFRALREELVRRFNYQQSVAAVQRCATEHILPTLEASR